MAYNVIDAYGSVIAIDSSLVSGVQRQNIAIASFLTAIPTTITGSPSISGAVTLVGTPSISGTVNLGPTSITALQGTNPWFIGNASMMLTPGINTIGSVATLQGTDPWRVIVPGSVVTVWQGSSVISISTGSVLGYWDKSPSIVGTYAEDAASADGDKGLFALGIRNDNVASFVSANLDYTGFATDSAGRSIVKPFAAEEARTSSVISTTAGTTSLLAAAGAGLRNYVTDALVTNTSSTATLVSFLDGDNSVLGRTIAPATSGSNVKLTTPMRTGGFNQIVQVQMVPITSTLGVTALGYKAP